jgi:glucose-6-phosphate 1-dehydrogenase
LYKSLAAALLAEKFGIEGRGQFYDATGAIRDVVENHMLQFVAFLAMEPPTPCAGCGEDERRSA